MGHEGYSYMDRGYFFFPYVPLIQSDDPRPQELAEEMQCEMQREMQREIDLRILVARRNTLYANPCMEIPLTQKTMFDWKNEGF
jgi:hypothetical protein